MRRLLEVHHAQGVLRIGDDVRNLGARCANASSPPSDATNGLPTRNRRKARRWYSSDGKVCMGDHSIAAPSTLPKSFLLLGFVLRRVLRICEYFVGNQLRHEVVVIRLHPKGTAALRIEVSVVL